MEGFEGLAATLFRIDLSRLFAFLLLGFVFAIMELRRGLEVGDVVWKRLEIGWNLLTAEYIFSRLASGLFTGDTIAISLTRSSPEPLLSVNMRCAKQSF